MKCLNLDFNLAGAMVVGTITVPYLEFGSRGGGVRPLPLVLRGQFLLNYNNFVHRENTISEHMAMCKGKKSAISLGYL